MLPILVRLGPVTIYSFGVLMAISVLIGSFLVWRQARKLGLSEEKVLDTLFLTIILAFIFGRLGFVYSHWAQFSQDWSRIFLVGKYPGLSFLTSLVTGIVVSGLLAKNWGMVATLIWDIFALAMSFVLSFGLLGCYLDGCVSVQPAYLTLILALVALLWWAGMMGLSKLLLRRAELSEISKRHGLFILGYLIFQVISLLMLGSAVYYWIALAVLIVFFVSRYWQLFRHLYDSIPKKRLNANI